MNNSNIGFIGGCINNQRGILREQLYYSVFSKIVSSSKESPGPKISLGQYFSYDQLLRQTEKFIAEKKPDLIFLFIRPFPLMPLQKPIIKYDKPNGKIGRTLHPALFMRKTKWHNKLTQHQSEAPAHLVERKKIELRDANLIAGILLGLHRWALRYLAKQIENIQQLCKERKIQFVLISPPKNPESIVANIICKWTTQYFNKYCNHNQIDFVNIYQFEMDSFEKDNIHFNVNGHEKLGQLLYDKIILEKSSSAQLHTP
jgi:hypothetical protein